MSPTGNEFAFSKGNDFPYRISLTEPNAASGIYEAATGKTITAFVAATKGGTPLGSTSTPLVEYSGAPGTYAAALDATVVDAIIPNQKVLWVAYKITNDLLVWQPVPVVTDRVAL